MECHYKCNDCLEEGIEDELIEQCLYCGSADIQWIRATPLPDGLTEKQSELARRMIETDESLRRN